MWEVNQGWAERNRRMYASGRGDDAAGAYVRWYNRVLPLGILPRRWISFEVAGRVSGRPIRLPLGLADLDGNWYLVSMLGECTGRRTSGQPADEPL